ncbi:MAG: metal-dependent transcriptional regulator [Lachnospiraceae bacterium]|nr:metal-dependent transcriptional regulator [Lachnospiraceae bacterium]
MNKQVGKSQEDYLKAILIQIKTAGACRMTDVADRLGFSKSSTSTAIKKLEDEGFVIRDNWRILLTDKGLEIAESLYEKYVFFKDLLIRCGVDEDTASSAACLFEHDISDDSFEKLKSSVVCRN